MSDNLKHECGLAFIRLKKPINYYYEKYGSAFYGNTKLYLLMEKQHNRGQDGAGIAIQKILDDKNQQYLYRDRIAGNAGLANIYNNLKIIISDLQSQNPEAINHPNFLKGNLPIIGEMLLGHLRYGTQGHNDVKFCHPFVKADIDTRKNLVMAGNFNIVNTQELFSQLSNVSCADTTDSDLGAMVNTLASELSQAVDTDGDHYDLKKVLEKSFAKFDGGFLTCGMIGDGNAFIVRDKNGIRPGYFFENEEFIVVASERPALMTTFDVPFESIKEVPHGHALIINKNAELKVERILEPAPNKACSFERIYFSRGSDEEIYKERKQLGRNLSEKVLNSINYNLKDAIFSYIPNTAETAFFGLIKGAEQYLNQKKLERICEIIDRNGSNEEVLDILERRVRIEKIAIKDAKLRTFITQDSDRDELVQHVYDVTYGVVRDHIDTIIIIDDSIVRGTTLKQSIIRMLDRLLPKKIIIVSSAPQIRYPDCYGIDMSKLGGFIAFQATIELLNKNNMQYLIKEVYDNCKMAINLGNHSTNFVKEIYKPFSTEEISQKISKMLKQDDIQAEVEVIYQSIEDLHAAIPNNPGDWYFSGDYPTEGGNKVVNTAFVNYFEGNNSRAY